MLSATYAIRYNKQLHMLEFTHDFFSDSSISPLARLFDDFQFSLAQIILDIYKSSILRVNYCSFDYTVYNAIFYASDIQCNELITDILFLHGKYRYHIKHHSDFLTQAKLAYWQNSIKGVDKPAILKMLYQNNKISEAYLLKYSAYNPFSLYESAKFSLFNKMSGEKAVQTEKIDELPLPRLIKEDIKLSFSR